MNKIKISLVIAFFATGLFVNCGDNKEKAIKYNDTIVDELNKLAKLEDDITKSDGADADKAIEEFKKAVPDARKKIEAVGKFKDSESLDKAALNLCDFYQDVIDGKYKDKTPDEINTKEVELYAALKQAQKDFAERFKIEIQQ